MRVECGDHVPNEQGKTDHGQDESPEDEQQALDSEAADVRLSRDAFQAEWRDVAPANVISEKKAKANRSVFLPPHR